MSKCLTSTSSRSNHWIKASMSGEVVCLVLRADAILASRLEEHIANVNFEKLWKYMHYGATYDVTWNKGFTPM